MALLRMDFVNTFSHEFKTPLISIRGFAKLLQNDDLTSEQRRTYTDTVVQQSERLAAMSTHVLELARYENTEIVSDKTLYSLDEQIPPVCAPAGEGVAEKEPDRGGRPGSGGLLRQ